MYCFRGVCKDYTGDFDSALKDYNTAISLDNEIPYFHLMRGRLHIKLNNIKQANIDFNEIIALDTTANRYSVRQYALLYLGDEKGSIEWMEKVVESAPNYYGVYYDKACVYALIKRPKEALNYLERALELGCVDFANIKNDRDLDSIRELPEFVVLINKYAPNKQTSEEVAQTKEEIISELPMKKMNSGIYEIGCSINSLPLKFILDTGASNVHISSVEANFMLKNGYLDKDDIRGKEYYLTASGEIKEGTMIRLKEIKIGDVILKNIDDSVMHNQQAPLLFGQSALEKFGIITIDNINSKIIIKQR